MDDIINSEIKKTFADLRKETNYDLPNWGLKVADILGSQRTLLKISNYLTDR